MNRTRQTPARTDRPGGLATPRRNRFFHGKMMDVYQFELETAYGIGMRRMLNRLVTGSGVICGLDVLRGDDPLTVEVTSGMAIDGWGREIIVPATSAPVTIPDALLERICGDLDDANGASAAAERDQRDDRQPAEREGSSAGEARRRSPRRHDRTCEDGPWVTVTLCYQECESDPVAVLAGDCSTTAPCAPGAIREQYRIGFEPGCAEPVDVSCRFPDILRQGEIDYGALARWVTRTCPDPPRNPCVPLANVSLECGGSDSSIAHIDIEIRPVVFGNPLLFDMLTRTVEEEQPGSDWRR
ncbi:hypothetical protein [Wenjunlia tyrosinilytica]|uniref:Uncharacterized protein n=1 Tax=Wenjunlia tyrosinilytica TaxID=1544741 RepID=A0A917ZUZ9_9ACTN|nr:hypothetical protein [Wenjunlia tyrosinilytica]GGO94443.1 hypothetical protein GCM10012280_49300 [Wenjunlia tyrosinilytica]